jgi:hypothetical protein
MALWGRFRRFCILSMALLLVESGGLAYSAPSSSIDGSNEPPAAIDYTRRVEKIDEPAIDEFVPGAGVGELAAFDGGFDMRNRDESQVPLFPTEDLIIPEALRSMRKAVSAIHATPAKADQAQGLNNRRLLDACILIAQIDFRKRGKESMSRVKAERLSPIFETRVTDLAKLANIPGKNYQRIYEELDGLFEMVLRWNIVGEDAETQWEMKSHFLSSLGYGRGHKRGLIRFSLDPSIMEIVLEPSNWATLSLQAMKGLGTAASYALYQNAWRYVNTNAKVTAALPTATWIELLLGSSGYVEDDPKLGKRVVRYGDFKRRHLLDAMRRVNDIPALGYTLELKELKSGTRVSKLQFKFIPKPNQSLGIPLTWPSDIVALLESIGFSAKEIQDISQARSFEEVADSIVKLKQAEERMKAQGRQISSKRAYFNGILANVAAGKSLDEIDHAKIEAEARAQEAQRTSAARHERLKDEFSRHAAARFAEELFALEEDARGEIFEAFAATDDARKARHFLAKGWSERNVPALSLLKAWMVRERPGQVEEVLANPEDRSFEAWLAWRADQVTKD